VLELPDVAELVDDEVLVDRRVLQQDQVTRGVAAEAPEAGHAEQPGHGQDPHAVEVDRLEVEAEPVEAGLRPREQLALAGGSRPEPGHR
jgi:hypothetical protein